MATLCLGVLRSSLRIVLSRSRWRKSTEHLELPNELWTEIFLELDSPSLVAVSRVSRVFNALAVPIYLAFHHVMLPALNAGTLKVPGDRQDIFPVLRTAFFLPPIRNLSCMISGKKRYQVIRYLRRFIAQQRELEEIHLVFYEDPFIGKALSICRRYSSRFMRIPLQVTGRSIRSFLAVSQRGKFVGCLIP